MKRHPFLFTLLVTCWLPLVGAAALITVQALRVTSKPVEYRATGKILASPGSPPISPSNQEKKDSDARKEFYNTQQEILESGKLKTRALDRVRVLHPELEAVDVKIRVTRSTGSSILKVDAIGREAVFTRVYFDAVLDEYIRDGAPDLGNRIMIMERPMTVVEDEPDLWALFSLWGILGAGVGGVLMLGIATVVSLSVRARTNH